MTARRALRAGIAGQDGSCLAGLLLQKGYTVVGKKIYIERTGYIGLVTETCRVR